MVRLQLCIKTIGLEFEILQNNALHKPMLAFCYNHGLCVSHLFH